MDKPLVSVIVPMYKVEEHLPHCLEVLREQTYTTLEVIFVDDASPDRSAAIVNEGKSTLEARGITVHLAQHLDNQGVAVARNTALDLATGEYVYSLDADDYLEPTAIAELVERAQESQADIVGCECYLSYEGRERHLSQADVHTGAEAFDLMCRGVLKWNLWLFLFRRELLDRGEQLRFLPTQNMGEDMLMMGRLFQRARGVSILHRPLYHYVKTNTQAQTSNYTATQWEQVATNLSALIAYTQANGDDQEIAVLPFLQLNMKLPLLISSRREDYRRWENWYPEVNDYVMDNKVQSIRTRLVQWAAAHRLWGLVWLYNELVMKRLYKLLYQ